MKWTNPGHEFDEIGKFFQENDELYIYTTDDCANALANNLRFLDKKIYFISEQSNDLCNSDFEYVALSDVLHNINGKIVLIPIGYTAPDDAITLFESSGYKAGKNLFWSPDFMEHFLPIYALYVCDILYFPSLCLICTTVCNLNCEKCLNFKPYSRKLEHRNLDSLKKEVDQLFLYVDRVELFHISGGEPFLYPDLNRLLTYIGEKYGDRIACLATVTNCTVMPDDDLCKALNKFNVLVQCDDYRKQLANELNIFEKIIEKFCENGIDYEVRTPITWIDLFPPKRDFFKLNDYELSMRYDACSNPFMELHNGKLCSCNYMGYAVSAGLIDNSDEAWFDLTKCSYSDIGRKKLLEFRMGYSMRGYVDFCKYCNGFLGVNSCSVLPAKQVKGTLRWSRKKMVD